MAYKLPVGEVVGGGSDSGSGGGGVGAVDDVWSDGMAGRQDICLELSDGALEEVVIDTRLSGTWQGGVPWWCCAHVRPSRGLPRRHSR
jgi:hypothetical protein